MMLDVYNLATKVSIHRAGIEGLLAPLYYIF